MRLLNSLFVLFFSTIIFSQSPWTQKKGETYTQLSFSTISDYEELFGDPHRSTERRITDNTLLFYGEYGLTNKTTLFAALPIKTVKSQDLINSSITPVTVSESITTSGNILLGAKHKIYDKNWQITAQLSVATKTNKYSEKSGLRPGYNAWTISPILVAGRGFEYWHIQAYTGFDFRTNNYSSAFKMGGEIGYKIASWFTFIGFADGIASFANGDVVIPRENRLTGLYVDKQSVAAMGLKSIFKIDPNFGINLGFGLGLGGRNVPKQTVVNGGIYYKFF